MSEQAAGLKADIEYRYGEGIDLPDGTIPGEASVAAILAHRTHRAYADREIDERILNLLLASTFSTPSKSDLQQCSVIVLRDGRRRSELAALIPSMPWIADAPVFLVFCGDSRRIRRICELRGKPFANDHLDAFVNAAADAAMHLSTFINAADAMGLGTCPISVLRNHIGEVCRILELPPGVFPLAGCCLGWPVRDGYMSMRLPLELSVHEDRYDDDKFERLLDQYDKARDAKFSIPEDRQRYVDDYGTADFYGWSEDKARQVSKPEREGLGAFLRGHGFRFD
jgi:nitroreductase/FMN reductase [NAD(P)H]